MSRPSRSSSISPFKELSASPSPSLPDEGYDEQRLDIPKWVKHWSDEQKAGKGLYAALAIQLLKSVSPSVFSRSYARLVPLFEYRDFLVLLPYELTVHLLSFLDASTLVNVALVSKAWNKFASDNAVWRGLYFRHGWTVNHEMVDWYINAAEQEEEWAVKARDVQSRVHFESEHSVSRGKRKMADCDMRDARDQDCGDYEMLHDVHDEQSALYDQYQDGLFPTHQHFALESSPTAHAEDVDMGHHSADEYDESSSPISIPPSTPTSRNTSASPEQSPSFSPSGPFPRSRSASSSVRTPTGGQRHGRFSLSSATFMPSLNRTRLPIYSLGSNLMTPPSMLRKMSQRNSPPAPLRIPTQPGSSSGSSASTPRSSRFFGHQRASSADQPRSGTRPLSPTMPTSPTLSNNGSNGPHSPLATKSLWSVIRHGVMGVSGSAAWPSLHTQRHADSGDPGPSSSSQQHHHHSNLSPSLPAWLMHLPSPLASASARYHSRSSSTPSASTTTAFPDSAFSTDMPGAKFEIAPPPIPRRIDFQAMNAPSPSEVLSSDVLRIHSDPITHRAAINWKFLCKQRRMLEQNWNRGIHSVREVPGHSEGIYCIQFDDHKIVSGSRDNTIKVWDMETGACRRTYVGHSASVLCLQYDEDRIVSGSSDATINVWDLNTGKVLQRLVGHADSVLSLRFEKDTVISCSKDRTVKIWKISTGEMLKTLIGHRAAVNAVQFSPESAAPSPLAGHPRVVVSASGDKSIKIWSFDTGECLRTLEGHTRGIACIQFEGNVIVSGSSDKTIKIWDIAKGECVKTLIGHEGLVRTLQFSGGRIISGSYDETLKIWEQESGRLLADLDGRHSHRVFKLQFNESKIVSCSQDQKIIIWDFAVGIDTTFF
ncbi:hypothetical protein EC968_001844 [Mortierella alpina]|nr:hypothetical protein EC968_001844 [Mortierella alpina]